MGNQLSRRRRQLDSKSSTSSTLTFPDSLQNGSSLSTNVCKFTQEVFPHSPTEATRQQGEHYLLKHIFQSSHFAPVDDILNKPDSKALDIGCGVHASWILGIHFFFVRKKGLILRQYYRYGKRFSKLYLFWL